MLMRMAGHHFLLGSLKALKWMALMTAAAAAPLVLVSGEQILS